jgi:predicted GIY-YIG superfamily endonuclease
LTADTASARPPAKTAGFGPRNRMGNTEMSKQYCVYILANQSNTVLYTGVTGELQQRVYQHREKLVPGFTSRYNVSKLVYYERTGA